MKGNFHQPYQITTLPNDTHLKILELKNFGLLDPSKPYILDLSCFKALKKLIITGTVNKTYWIQGLNDCFSLEVVELKNCALTGSEEISILDMSRLRNIKELFIQSKPNNPFKIQNLNTCSFLEKLRLQFCELLADLKINGSQNALMPKSLEQIFLSSVLLHQPLRLQNCLKLKTLIVTRLMTNEKKFSPVEGLRFCITLEKISIVCSSDFFSNEGLKDEIANLPESLIEINLSSNRFEDFNRLLDSKLPKLNKLFLRDNGIRYLSEKLFNLPPCCTIDLRLNRINFLEIKSFSSISENLKNKIRIIT
ncbi:MAG: hypothetical protein ACOVOR_01545 [Rhabdochlamydiaceae bacterium]